MHVWIIVVCLVIIKMHFCFPYHSVLLRALSENIKTVRSCPDEVNWRKDDALPKVPGKHLAGLWI